VGVAGSLLFLVSFGRRLFRVGAEVKVVVEGDGEGDSG
jgi:hypothetical protein